MRRIRLRCALNRRAASDVYLIALRAVRRAEFGMAVYCVAELPNRRTCVILCVAFLHRMNYSGIGVYLHEGEAVLF